MKALLVAVAVALALPSAAPAHVDVSPALLESGREVELLVELPELRPGAGPTGLEVSAAGVQQLSSTAAGRAGVETRWRVRVRVEAEPGPAELLLRAAFADGEAVEVRRRVTVVPPAAEEGVPPAAFAAAAVALLALVAAAVALRRRAPR